MVGSNPVSYTHLDVYKRQGKNTAIKNYDVCICGAGPAGITIARILAEAGKTVALLEGGGLERTEDSQNIYQGKNIGLNNWDAVFNCRLRYLGGTSNHWSCLLYTSRCV